jgi:hypothetical protein
MLLLGTALLAAVVARGFEQGAWWARLPLKNSGSSPYDSSGDLNGTIAALKAAKMTLVGFDAGVCGSAATPGDTGTGGVGIADLVSFLDAAAVQYPGLSVFAGMSSHHPVADYCHLYLNDQKTDVNWTRVGAVIANRTQGRSNFMGIYIDDFYAMMCTPESTTYSRHGSPALPCVPVSAMDDMRGAMHAINPSLAFFPLVYHVQTAFVVPGSFVLGAGAGTSFIPPARAAATIALPPAPSDDGDSDDGDDAGVAAPKAMTLRFFYHCELSAWANTMGSHAASERTHPVNGTVLFQATLNGHVLLSVDASTVHDISIFETDVSQWLHRSTGRHGGQQGQTDQIVFSTFPTAAAADTNHTWMRKDAYKTSYVFGLTLNGQPLAAPVKYSTSDGKLLAREPTESRLTGHAEALMMQRQQVPSYPPGFFPPPPPLHFPHPSDKSTRTIRRLPVQVPSYMLPTAGYRKLMELVVAANPHSRVFGCAHYSISLLCHSLCGEGGAGGGEKG